MDILKNEIKTRESDETTLEICVVKRGTGEIIDTVLIDNNDEIKEMILKRSWFVNDDNYAMTKIDKNFVYMHQLIWGYYFGDDFIPRKESQKVIDHLNNNHFDNRIRNLHILTENHNKTKKLIDANFDNLSVYVDYDYSQNISEVKEKQLEKEIYKNRKYVISYISENMIFHTNKENDQFFNSFELVYDDYKKFIEDAKNISSFAYKKYSDKSGILSIQVSNALLLKAALPDTKISVDSSCCAGVTPQSHENALKAMAMCQVEVK